MTTDQVDGAVATPDAEAGAGPLTVVTDPGRGRSLANQVPDRLTGALRRAPAAIRRAGLAARTLLARVPGTIRTTRAGANRTTSALQTLGDPTLRGLAATSVGLGAGLYAAGAPRLAVAAGVVPAVIMGAAIVLRPVEPSASAEPSR